MPAAYPYMSRDLNRIMAILGTTKASLWPFRESTGVVVGGISAGANLVPAETAGAAEALEDDFAPWEHVAGIHSYYFTAVGDHHLAGGDHADYSHGNGTVDTAFSLFGWIQPVDITTVALMAKYDSAGNLEEWKWGLDGSGQLELELHDASASASEIAAGSQALVVGQWQFVCTTYDGDETDPGITHYIGDGGSASDELASEVAAATETGSYVAMENTAAPLTIACAGVTALPTEEYTGRLALPGMTGKELSSTEVRQIYDITRKMIGF